MGTGSDELLEPEVVNCGTGSGELWEHEVVDCGNRNRGEMWERE